MNKEQFEIIAAHLPIARRHAAECVILHKHSDTRAETLAHSKKTNTVRRDVNAITMAYTLAMQIADAGDRSPARTLEAIADMVEALGPDYSASAPQDIIDAIRQSARQLRGKTK